MGGATSKRIGLFLLLFGVPLIFLMVLSRGDTEYNGLKFYAKNITDSGRIKVNDFLFYDVDSNAITKESLEGKSIIITTLIPSCPAACPVLSKQLGEYIYNPILHETRLKDFIIVSQLIDTNGNQVDLASFIKEQPVNAEKWKIVTGPQENPVYDFDLPNAKLNQDSPKDNVIGGKTYYKMILLIDKNHYLRGIYQGDKTPELKRLQQEIKVLEREYKEELEKNKEVNI